MLILAALNLRDNSQTHFSQVTCHYMMSKIFKRTLLAAGILILGAAIYNYPKLSIISGYAAKNMASTLYIAKRSFKSVDENDHNVPLIKLAVTELDKEDDAVSASVFGLMERRAICRNGLGCTLVNDGRRPAQNHQRPHRTMNVPNLPFPYGNTGQRDSIFPNVDYNLLQKALDGAFLRPEMQKTRTVLVVYKDHIIAERYSRGFTRETPILGWSMTKSVFATFFGILEYQKKIDVATFRPFLVHGSPGVDKKDPRNLITLNHLLRMQSGLAWDEDYTSISDVNKMLFLEDDMSRSQIEKEVVAAPAEIWNYSSGTTNYLSGILRKELGSYQDYLNFPYVELIDKIGMSSMLLEVDMAGNFVGSSYGWASTRDWAKFGLLYLHRGNWNGQQIFAPEWVDYVTLPTAHSDSIYGAHFRLNAGGRYPNVPRDLYSADGYQGQRIFIIPSKDLVVVRTGLAEPPDFDILTFLQDVTASIR